MKRAPRKPRRPKPKKNSNLSIDEQMLVQIDYLTHEHNYAWLREITSDAPHWTGALALHLRLVELEHLEEGLKELL